MEIDSVILKNKDEFKKFYTLLSSKININNMKLLYKKYCIDNKNKYTYKAEKGVWIIE